MPEEKISIPDFEVAIRNPDTNEEKKVTIGEYTPPKGRGKDSVFLYPKGWETKTLKDWTDLYGDSPFYKVVVQPRLKQLWNMFSDEARFETVKRPDGSEEDVLVTDVNSVIKDFSEMFAKNSRRGETILALTTRHNEILQEQSIILEAMLDANDEERAKLMVQARALKEELTDIRTSLKDKKRQKDRVEEAPKLDEEKRRIAA